MHLIRRSAFRVASASPSTSFISNSRTITTASPFFLRSKPQTGISSSVFRRFNSDDASEERKERNVEDADGEHGSVRSAIDSATETASTYAHDAAESLTNNAEQARDAVYDDGAAAAAAATGFSGARREERPSYNNQNGSDRGGFGGDRGGYGRGGDRGGYGGDRGGLGADRRGGGFQQGARPPIERNLTPTAGVYIGNLLFDITAADLTREFEQFGTIKSAVIASDARGLSKGFGYVEFEDIPTATAAIEAKHQTVLEGRRLIVNYMAKTQRQYTPNPPSKTLFIGNLAFEMSDADLNKLFRDIRNVIDVRVAIDRRTGQPRGFAHADFTDAESAGKALEVLKDKEIYGRTLRVDYSVGTTTTTREAGDRSERADKF